MKSIGAMKGVEEAMATLRYSLRCRTARRGLFAAVFAAAICLVIALAWWGPAAREQTQLSNDIAVRRGQIVKAARAEEVERAHRQALTAIALFEKKLGVQAGQADLIQGIAKLALQRGVRVVSQSFDEGRAQGGDAALYLELGLTGNYISMRRLLSDFAGLPMWVEVVEARIERSGDGGGQIRAQLRLRTYRAVKVPAVSGGRK